MKKILRLCILSVMIVSMFCTVQVPNAMVISQSRTTRSQISPIRSKITTTLTDHAPINITNNAGFSGCSCATGSGTLANPFVIANFFINGGYTGIEIESTTSYFTIRNVWVNGTTHFGIYLFNVYSSTVINNNTITNIGQSKDPNYRSFAGIFISIAHDVTITGNFINNTSNGMLVMNSRYNDITNNTILYQAFTGINNNACSYNTLSNNFFNHDEEDVMIETSIGVKVLNNTFMNSNIEELSIFNDPYLLVAYNTFSGGPHGVFAVYNDNSIFVNNTLVDTYGFYDKDSKNLTIANNTAVNNPNIAFEFDHISNSSISNNIVNGSQADGFVLYVSNNNTLANNTASNEADGFFLNFASNNVLKNNVAYHNSISDVSVFYNSTHDTLSNNNFTIIRYPTVPSAPTKLNYTLNSANNITLRWSELFDGGSLITQYNIYRSNSSNGSFTLINSTAGGIIFTLNDIIPTGGIYYYYIVAVNKLGKSARSTTLVVITPTSYSPNISSSSISTSKKLSFSNSIVLLIALGCLMLYRKRLNKNNK